MRGASGVAKATGQAAREAPWSAAACCRLPDRGAGLTFGGRQGEDGSVHPQMTQISADDGLVTVPTEENEERGRAHGARGARLEPGGPRGRGPQGMRARSAPWSAAACCRLPDRGAGLTAGERPSRARASPREERRWQAAALQGAPRCARLGHSGNQGGHFRTLPRPRYFFVKPMKLRIMVLPQGVRMLSGWYCTPQMGNSRCATAMMTPSSVSAVMSRQGGQVSRLMTSEW